MLSIILLSKLIPYAEEILRDHQYEFRHSRSTTAHILCIRQVLEKKWEYNEAVPQLFIDFRKACDSVRRVLDKILTELGIPTKLVILIQMCPGRQTFSDMFPIKNGLKQEYALSPLLFNFALEYANRRFRCTRMA